MEKYEKQIRGLRLFTTQTLIPIVGDEHAARGVVRKYKRKNLICLVFRELYAFINPKTKTHTITRYELGSQITQDAYLSFHSALEYHGVVPQLLNEMSVVSKKPFSEFTLDGIHYSFVRGKIDIGVYSPDFSSLIWITDLERTVVDCFDRVELAGGLIEFLRCLCLIVHLDEKKLLLYLEAYDRPMLYRKVGCILSFYQETVQISDDFFAYCKTKIGDGVYDECPFSVPRVHIKEWRAHLSNLLYACLNSENRVRSRRLSEISKIYK